MSRGLPERLRVRPMGTNGRWACRYCHGDLPGKKTSYCSPDCSREFRILNEPETARAWVFLRDRGTCAGCGLDTVAWRIQREEELRPGSGRLWTPPDPLESAPGSFMPVVTQRFKRDPWRMGAWEMDHVVEVARGGDSSLGNLQTLCSLGEREGCHYEKTRRFAAERSLARRLIAKMG